MGTHGVAWRSQKKLWKILSVSEILLRRLFPFMMESAERKVMENGRDKILQSLCGCWKNDPKNKLSEDFLPFRRENNLKLSKTFDKGYLGCIKGFTQENQCGVWVWRDFK